MKRIITLIVFIFFALGTSQVHAQIVKDFVKKRKEAADEAATERVDREITKGVNKGLDKIFGKENPEEAKSDEGEVSDGSDEDYSSNSSSSNSRMDMSGLLSAMGMGGSVDVKDLYKFDAYIEMSITHIDGDGEAKEPGTYTSYISEDTPDYGISFKEDGQQEEVLMIFDTENSLMLTLMEADGEKTGFAVGFDEETQQAIAESYSEAEEEEYEGDDNPYNIKKTGKTKKILGYKCDEYQTEDENSSVSMWITEELEKELKKTYMNNANFAGMFAYAYFTKGFVMEYVVVDKDDNDKTIMTVTDIDLDNKTSINTSTYTIMNMGAMQEMEEDE